MSRFIDKLKQASQAEHPPMGFKAAKKTFEKRRMLLVAEVKDSVAAGVVEGADAVLLQGTIKNTSAKTDLPVGIRLFGNKAGRMEGIDYVVFPPETPFTIDRDEKTGKIMAVEAPMDGGLIRAINELPVDAVFVDICQNEENFLTWQQLMHFRYFASLLTKSLLVPVPSNITGDELQLLWELGVGGVVVETTSKQPAGGLKKLRQIVDSLTPPSKRKRMKARALVPTLREEARPVIEEDEEEEDE